MDLLLKVCLCAALIAAGVLMLRDPNKVWSLIHDKSNRPDELSRPEKPDRPEKPKSANAWYRLVTRIGGVLLAGLGVGELIYLVWSLVT